MENPDVIQNEKNNSFISETFSFGIKGMKSFGKVFIIFLIVNIIAIIVSLSYKLMTPTLYVFIIAVLFTFLALYITYKHVFLLSISHLYQYATPVFKRIADLIVDKYMNIPISELQTQNKSISKVIDVGKIIAEIYGKKVPSFGKKAIKYMVNKIPLVPIISELKSETNNFENKEEVKDLTYLKLDAYIQKNVLATNLTSVYIVLLINILVQICVIFYFVQKSA